MADDFFSFGDYDFPSLDDDSTFAHRSESVKIRDSGSSLSSVQEKTDDGKGDVISKSDVKGTKRDVKVDSEAETYQQKLENGTLIAQHASLNTSNDDSQNYGSQSHNHTSLGGNTEISANDYNITNSKALNESQFIDIVQNSDGTYSNKSSGQRNSDDNTYIGRNNLTAVGIRGTDGSEIFNEHKTSDDQVINAARATNYSNSAVKTSDGSIVNQRHLDDLQSVQNKTRRQESELAMVKLANGTSSTNSSNADQQTLERVAKRVGNHTFLKTKESDPTFVERNDTVDLAASNDIRLKVVNNSEYSGIDADGNIVISGSNNTQDGLLSEASASNSQDVLNQQGNKSLVIKVLSSSNRHDENLNETASNSNVVSKSDGTILVASHLTNKSGSYNGYRNENSSRFELNKDGENSNLNETSHHYSDNKNGTSSELLRSDMDLRDGRNYSSNENIISGRNNFNIHTDDNAKHIGKLNGEYTNSSSNNATNGESSDNFNSTILHGYKIDNGTLKEQVDVDRTARNNYTINNSTQNAESFAKNTNGSVVQNQYSANQHQDTSSNQLRDNTTYYSNQDGKIVRRSNVTDKLDEEINKNSGEKNVMKSRNGNVTSSRISGNELVDNSKKSHDVSSYNNYVDDNGRRVNENYDVHKNASQRDQYNKIIDKGFYENGKGKVITNHGAEMNKSAGFSETAENGNFNNASMNLNFTKIDNRNNSLDSERIRDFSEVQIGKNMVKTGSDVVNFNNKSNVNSVDLQNENSAGVFSQKNTNHSLNLDQTILKRSDVLQQNIGGIKSSRLNSTASGSLLGSNMTLRENLRVNADGSRKYTRDNQKENLDKNEERELLVEN
ncbi:unnamed protein product [Caenorhabditis angaria]|uniref:Uncharacterized protein n=1 Tax=Caenorhabditis angaria TaxID=860376 RepID=A0A9P1IHF0_9PELO|nr:unnamed protein product [Caenorhabditis angaria]